MAVINTRLLFVNKHNSKFYYRDVRIFTSMQDLEKHGKARNENRDSISTKSKNIG